MAGLGAWLAVRWTAFRASSVSAPTVLMWLAVALAAGYAGGTWLDATPSLPQAAPAHLGIAELAEKIRSELSDLKLNRISKGEEALFELETLDLEIGFVVKASTKKKGELEYQVVTLGTESEQSREKSHRITLHLKTIPPRWVESPSADLKLLPEDKPVELPPITRKGQ